MCKGADIGCIGLLLALLAAVPAVARQPAPAASALFPADHGADMRASLPRDPDLLPVFRAFGGRDGLRAVVEDLMANLMADPRTRHYFERVDRERIKDKLVEQFCVILGGPCRYSGDNMREVHRGLHLARADFNALVEDLQKAMDRHDVPFHAQNVLLARLAPMHTMIVGD